MHQLFKIGSAAWCKLLTQIDHESQSTAQNTHQAKRQATLLLLLVGGCLLLIQYLKSLAAFHGALSYISTVFNQPPHYLQAQLYASRFAELAGELWWASWHVVGYLIIPLCYIRYVMRQPLSNFGVRWGNTHKHLVWYSLLLGMILILIMLVSGRNDFLAHYPFYRLAHRSWFDLLAWECMYITQFIVLEFFFRGFIVQGLRPAFGANAVFIMCLPYLMIHFPKPWLEATGALFFGIFLGVLAIRSGSIWGGVLVHVGIAVSMDLAVLDNLPARLWPL